MPVGEDRLEYTEDASSPAESIFESKILFNRTISDAHRGARFIACVMKNIILGTPMSRAEYMIIYFKYSTP